MYRVQLLVDDDAMNRFSEKGNPLENHPSLNGPRQLNDAVRVFRVIALIVAAVGLDDGKCVVEYRDVVVSYLRVFSALTGTAMGRRTSGKWKGILQGATALVILALLIIDNRFISIPYLSTIIYALLVFVTAYTVFSLFEYLHGNRHLLIEIRRRGRA